MSAYIPIYIPLDSTRSLLIFHFCWLNLNFSCLITIFLKFLSAKHVLTIKPMWLCLKIVHPKIRSPFDFPLKIAYPLVNIYKKL